LVYRKLDLGRFGRVDEVDASEERKLATDPRRRTSARMLRKLAAGHMLSRRRTVFSLLNPAVGSL